VVKEKKGCSIRLVIVDTPLIKEIKSDSDSLSQKAQKQLT